MTQINWTEDNLKILKEYGDKREYYAAAKLFNCSVNAIQIAYGRHIRNAGKIKDNKSDVNRDPVIVKSNENDLFIIEQVPYTGIRGTNEIVIKLATAMINMKADKIDSILIPLNLAKTARTASNIFNQAKKYIFNNVSKEMVYTIKSFYSVDQKKIYLSARIWRIK